MRAYYFRPLQRNNDHPKLLKSEQNITINIGETVFFILEREKTIEKFKRKWRRHRHQLRFFKRKQSCILVTNTSPKIIYVRQHASLFSVFCNANIEICFLNTLIGSLDVFS